MGRMKEFFIDLLNRRANETEDAEYENYCKAIAFQTFIYSGNEDTLGEKMEVTLDLRDFAMCTSINEGRYTALGNGTNQSIVIESPYNETIFYWELIRQYK